MMLAASAPVLHLAVPNQRGALEPARLAVMEFLLPHSPGARVLFNIELVLEETLMNVVWHAFDDDAPHLVDLHVEVLADAIEMRFEDDGKPFDPTQAGDPVPASSLEEAAPGGLGLLLVRRFARSVDYARVDGRNRLSIKVALD